MQKPWPVMLTAYSLGIGGSERQLCEIAKSLDRRWFEPHVGCFHPEGMRADELRQAGVPLVKFATRSLRSPATLSAAASVGRYLRQHDIAMVHSFDVPSTIFAVPVARLYRTPAVLSSQRAYRDLSSGLYRRLLQVTDRLVDGIVVNCQAIKLHLVEQ